MNSNKLFLKIYNIFRLLLHSTGQTEVKVIAKRKENHKKHHQKQHRQKDSSTTMANVFGYCDC